MHVSNIHSDVSGISLYEQYEKKQDERPPPQSVRRRHNALDRRRQRWTHSRRPTKCSRHGTRIRSRTRTRLLPRKIGVTRLPTETSRGRKRDPSYPDICVYANNQKIPIVNCIRILGLRLQSNGHNKETILHLEKSAQLTMRLICRVANKNRGMKEDTLIRLVQTFGISKITHCVPFLQLKIMRKSKLMA